MISRKILKFDWPRVALLYGGGLHYSQVSFDGWENDVVVNVVKLF